MDGTSEDTREDVTSWRTSPMGRLVIELVLISVYSFCVLVFFFDGADDKHWWTIELSAFDVVAGIVGLVLWVFFLVRFIIGIRAAESRREYLIRHAAIPCLLVSIVFTYATWAPMVAVSLIVLAFVLEVRQAPEGYEWQVAATLLVFMSVMLTVALVEVERAESTNSDLADFADAYGWSLARLTRVNLDGLPKLAPVTEDGRNLTILLGICATLFAAVLVGGIATWLLKRPEAEEQEAGDSDIADLTRQVQELRAAIDSLQQRLTGGDDVADPTRSDGPAPGQSTGTT